MALIYVAKNCCLIITEMSRDELRRKGQYYRKKSVAESTQRNRDMQWKSYKKACEMYNWRLFPCSLEQACLYVTYLAERLSYSSIIAYYSAVVYMHVCEGLEPVRLSNPILRATLEGIGKTKGKSNGRKDAILPSHLKELAKVVDVKSVWEVLIFTCILFLFRTLLRVSHVALSSHTLLNSDVKFNANGMLVCVRSSKTVKRGEELVYIPVAFAEEKSICAVRWLKVFRGMVKASRGGFLFALDGQPIPYNKILKGFKCLLKKAGIVGDFATHSLRRGGATHMSMSGCSVAEVKQRGRWKSNCVFRYIKQPVKHMLKVDRKVVKLLH